MLYYLCDQYGGFVLDEKVSRRLYPNSTSLTI